MLSKGRGRWERQRLMLGKITGKMLYSTTRRQIFSLASFDVCLIVSLASLVLQPELTQTWNLPALVYQLLESQACTATFSFGVDIFR